MSPKGNNVVAKNVLSCSNYYYFAEIIIKLSVTGQEQSQLNCLLYLACKYVESRCFVCTTMS